MLEESFLISIHCCFFAYLLVMWKTLFSLSQTPAGVSFSIFANLKPVGHIYLHSISIPELLFKYMDLWMLSFLVSSLAKAFNLTCQPWWIFCARTRPQWPVLFPVVTNGLSYLFFHRGTNTLTTCSPCSTIKHKQSCTVVGKSLATEREVPLKLNRWFIVETGHPSACPESVRL